MRLVPPVSQVEEALSSCEARVTRGLQMKAQGELIVANALRQMLDAVGETKWLVWCSTHWGWGRSTAYAHLNPEGMAKERVRDKARKSRPGIPDPTSRQDTSRPGNRDAAQTEPHPDEEPARDTKPQNSKRTPAHFEQAIEEAKDWMRRWRHISALAPVFDELIKLIEETRT